MTAAQTWRELLEANATINKLRAVLRRLKRGDCWCEMAVGNPMVSSHDEACLEAQRLLAEKR